MNNNPFSPFPEPFPEEPQEKKQQAPAQTPGSEFISMGWSQPVEQLATKQEPAARPQNKLPKPAEEDEKPSAAKIAGTLVVLFVLIFGGYFLWQLLQQKETQLPPVVDNETTDELPDSADVIQKEKKFFRSSEGGRLVLLALLTGSADAEVIIPPGALREDVEIEIERVKKGTVTDLYHFKPEGLKFLIPVTVVIPYKESGLAPGQTPHDIKLGFWLKNPNVKRFLSFTVDTLAKTIRAQVSEF